jgi:serralysin
MLFYSSITTTAAPAIFYIQPNLLGSNPNGGNIIQGGANADTIYGESSGDLFSGNVGCNLIYGGGGSNTIYGDAHGLFGNVFARGNTIWADAPNANDGFAVNTIYGNAYVMGNNATAAGNFIHDSYGNTSYLYGNAYHMQDHAWGGYNTITALSSTSYVYGDAYSINCADFYELGRGYGVVAGHNTITFNSADGEACGDAHQIQGDFVGGHNTIYIGNQQQAVVAGTADMFNGPHGDVIQCGWNVIYAGSGSDLIVGDVYSNSQVALGGHNTIYGGSGTNSIYGDCRENDLSGEFHGGYNTIRAGSGAATIYGDCNVNSGGATFYGGHNTIYGGIGNAAGVQGNEDIWGGWEGSNKFVFAPGTGTVKIEDFDHHGYSTTFNHAEGDVIDLAAYHLAGMQNLVIGANASGDAVITLPAAGASHPGQITLVGVHPGDLVASDFHF